MTDLAAPSIVPSQPWVRREIIGGFELYHGDSEAILPILHRFDAVVTDPPYGIGMGRGVRGGGKGGHKGKYARKPRAYSGGEWDRTRPSRSAIAALLAAAPTHIVWGGQYLADLLPVGEKWLYWDKLNGMPSYSDGELAWTSLEGVALKSFSWCNNGKASAREGRLHPTQKPVAVMEWCLGFLPGCRRIVDPYMGSGTTIVAAIRVGGFGGAGIERDAGHFASACDRIAAALEEAFAAPQLISAAEAPVQLGLLD